MAYLLLHREPLPSRQRLAFHFWPDSGDSQARANLRKLVYRLRQTMPELEDYLNLDGPDISWRSPAPLRLDVERFEAGLRQAEAAPLRQQPELRARALAYYRGELLPDLYDDWILPFRERLRQRHLDALDLLAGLLEARREYAAAGARVRELLRHDPLRESAYRRLMRLQALAGDTAAVESHARVALERWGSQHPVSDPMQWLAYFPLLVLSVATGEKDAETAAARIYAQAMLTPSQQHLPDPLVTQLAAGVGAAEPAVTFANLHQACRLAQDYGYL